MLEYGKDTGLPETYRITLAVSVALLAHTLLVATVPFSLPEHNQNPVTVSVQLTPRGSTPAIQNAPSQATPPVRATPFTIEEAPASPQPARNRLTASSTQPRTIPEPSPTEPDRTSRLREQSAPSSSNRASAPNVAGEQPTRQEDSVQDATLRSKAPSEESSYISLLVQTIAEKGSIRKLDNFEEGKILSVELELNLMSNGALVGARITESSGNDGLDQRVYRAALAASPYPEPPSSNSHQRRFRVEVKYTF